MEASDVANNSAAASALLAGERGEAGGDPPGDAASQVNPAWPSGLWGSRRTRLVIKSRCRCPNKAGTNEVTVCPYERLTLSRALEMLNSLFKATWSLKLKNDLRRANLVDSLEIRRRRLLVDASETLQCTASGSQLREAYWQSKNIPSESTGRTTKAPRNIRQQSAETTGIEMFRNGRHSRT
jgi:hypothetical protein